MQEKTSQKINVNLASCKTLENSSRRTLIGRVKAARARDTTTCVTARIADRAEGPVVTGRGKKKLTKNLQQGPKPVPKRRKSLVRRREVGQRRLHRIREPRPDAGDEGRSIRREDGLPVDLAFGR